MVRAMVYAGLPQDVQVMAKYQVHSNEYGMIIMAVCVGLKVSKADLLGVCRKRDLVEARQIAFYLLRTLTDLTLEQIGSLFNRAHTTVIYGKEMCEQLLDVDVAFQKKMYKVKSLL